MRAGNKIKSAQDQIRCYTKLLSSRLSSQHTLNVHNYSYCPRVQILLFDQWNNWGSERVRIHPRSHSKLGTGLGLETRLPDAQAGLRVLHHPLLLGKSSAGRWGVGTETVGGGGRPAWSTLALLLALEWCHFCCQRLIVRTNGAEIIPKCS